MMTTEKKRMALVLFGISFGSTHHWTNKVFEVDWRCSLSNYKTHLFDHFSEDFAIDVYGATFSHYLLDVLKKSYDMKSIKIARPRTNRLISRHWCVIAALQALIESGEVYDTVLLTRYDLEFKIPFSQVFIDYRKINLVSRLEKEGLICDNFYLFPFELLTVIYDTMYEYGQVMNYHYMTPHLEKIAPLHFFYNQKRKVENLDFYKIRRKEIGVWEKKDLAEVEFVDPLELIEEEVERASEPLISDEEPEIKPVISDVEPEEQPIISDAEPEEKPVIPKEETPPPARTNGRVINLRRCRK